MRYKLRSIDVLSAAKLSAFLHGCLGLVFIPFFLLGALIGPANAAPGAGPLRVMFAVLAIALPLLYAGMGFVTGALISWLYNFTARHFGPMEIQLDLVDSARQFTPGV